MRKLALGRPPSATLASKVEWSLRAHSETEKASHIPTPASEIRDITTAGASLITSLKTGSATYDPASLADAEGVTTTVTVTGAALGDFAMASFSNALQGITLTAWVSATNTVSVRFQNESGGVLDLASGTLKAAVFTT
jgi:hypothetical protein